MNYDRILTFILALAVLGLVARVLMNRPQSADRTEKESLVQTTPPGDIVFENIMTRSSIREYTTQPVVDELLVKLVRSGMAAPTARNTQPWKFIIINDRKVLDALAEKLPNAKMLAQAPAAIAVCGDLTKAIQKQPEMEYWVQDCSAATENILLAAHGFGLGAVWTGGYPSAQRVIDIRTELNLSEHLVPLCVIAIGYPKDAGTPKDKWKDENLLWNRQRAL